MGSEVVGSGVVGGRVVGGRVVGGRVVVRPFCFLFFFFPPFSPSKQQCIVDVPFSFGKWRYVSSAQL